jgi:beta-carotene 3-hydroxylase
MLYWISNLVVFVLCFVVMEGVAWFTHKYIMHGFLWKLHADHHKPGYRMFELNDLFGVFFASVAIYLIVSGALNNDLRLPAGIGVTAYGAAYFWVHDIFVHQRVKWLTRTENQYLRALRKAHKIHHKKMGKHGAEAFGFLFVHPKYFNNK